MTHFPPFHQDLSKKVHKALDSFFDTKMKEAKDKDDVLVDTVKLLKEFVLRGGKRVGPMMVVLGYQLAEEVENNYEKIKDEVLIKAACAVEIHHLYLLNLDDMADRDVLRHGGKTLEEYYRTELFQNWNDKDHHGRTFSSIAGALLNSYTFEILRTSGFPPEKIDQAIGIITDMLFADTVTGWQIQYFQNNESIQVASEERFLKGLEFVTSRYKFVGPLLIGLSLALNNDNQHFHTLKQAYIEYGKHVGIAFQLYDDIMGMFGDAKEMGKAVGNDVREGKKTLLLQYAYHHGNTEQQLQIESAIGTQLNDKQLEALQHLIKDTGALKYSEQLAHDHVKQAIEALKKFPKESKEVKILTELAHYMIERKK